MCITFQLNDFFLHRKTNLTSNWKIKYICLSYLLLICRKYVIIRFIQFLNRLFPAELYSIENDLLFSHQCSKICTASSIYNIHICYIDYVEFCFYQPWLCFASPSYSRWLTWTKCSFDIYKLHNISCSSMRINKNANT